MEVKTLINTLYAIVAWFVVGTIDHGSWLFWAVLALAIDHSIGTVWKAITDD